MEVNVTYEVTEERLRDMLIGAFESASTYFCRIKGYECPKGASKKDFQEGGKYAIMENGEALHVAYVLPFMDGGAVVLEDIEDGTTFTLTLQKLQEGVKVMAKKYPKHFANLINENDDAETADVFLQMCLFGELVYG